MHWKLKAVTQNVLAALPGPLSQEGYYRVQRLAGGLRRIDPMKRLAAGVTTWRRLTDAGADPRGKTFFEVGTGRMLNVPLAYWLMGAERTITVDLNPYLKGELVHEAARAVARRRDEVADLLGERLVAERLDRLAAYAEGPRFTLDGFCALTGVEHHAPCDATATGLPAGSIDFHTSYTVLEHVPPTIIRGIFVEADRLLRPGGLAVHGVDYSDHFAHADGRITAANFLRYPQRTWDRWAGNSYMYMNRLRHPQYLGLMAEAGFGVADCQTNVDKRSLDALRSGELRPHTDFAGYDAPTLATDFAWIVARPGADVAAEAA